MKVDYIKFSDERNKRFSIKTIVRPEGVYKEAIFPEGKAHVEKMLKTQKELKKYYSKAELCPVRPEGKGIVFDFIQGETLLEQYKSAVSKGDKAFYEELLKLHKELVCGDESNACTFEAGEEFRSWFGEAEAYEHGKGLKYSNFDAIASNIIFREGNPVFIDYEWVMEFVMPQDLVIYHCVKDSYIHVPELEEFYPLEKAMEFLGVSTDVEAMEKSYKAFYEYVVCDENGRSYAKDKFLCLKPMYDPAFVMGEWQMCAREWTKSVEIVNILNAELEPLRAEHNARLGNRFKRVAKRIMGKK